MAIGLIADLHDHLTNFDEFLRQTMGQLDALWIAGDVGTADTLAYVCDQFSGAIYAVAGNTEDGHGLTAYEELAHRYPHLVWSSQEPLAITSETFSATLFHFPNRARAYSQSGSEDIIAFGHSHRPSLKKVGPSWLVNPGTLAGVFTPATYTYIDTLSMSFRLERIYQQL